MPVLREYICERCGRSEFVSPIIRRGPPDHCICGWHTLIPFHTKNRAKREAMIVALNRRLAALQKVVEAMKAKTARAGR